MSQPWLDRKEQIEITFWRDSPLERPEADSPELLIHKLSEARVFWEYLQDFRSLFVNARSALELGAGQGWAACLLKRLYPDCRVLASDISNYALASAPKWERVFQVQLDGTIACRSYAIPLPDASLDLVYCFQSAHHFARHRRTLQELFRILAPGGTALYLYEPGCRAWLHRFAHARVNAKRPEVPEDVLIYPKILQLAKEVGFEAQVRFNPSLACRGPGALLYYWALQKLPLLQQVLPCTVDFVFCRPGSLPTKT